MIRFLKRPLVFLFIVYLFSTCIDPFNPRLNYSESLLVVDGFLTNENRSYKVKLSRSSGVQDGEASMVSGALVSIRDNNGTSSMLLETSAGIYQTDSLLIRGEIGNSYILHIKTPDGNEYESDPCFLYPVQRIEKIYYQKDQEITNNGSVTNEGIRILLDTDNNYDNKYFRWIYNEYWKNVVPNPKTYDYINDSTILRLDQVNQTCWKYNKSDDIIIHSTDLEQTDKIEKESILFIPSDKTDRLLVQYCIEIKQLSLSRQEFEFWDHMKQINESGGDIFEKQPFPIISNIHNVNNPQESVLGYFQVSSVEEKRIYITARELLDFNIPMYSYDCDRIERGPSDYPPPLVPAQKMTFDKIYKLYVGPEYDFVEPVYDLRGKLQKLAFAKRPCTDCSLNGSIKKPDFWSDVY